MAPRWLLVPLLLLTAFGAPGALAGAPTSCDGGEASPMVRAGLLAFDERVAFGLRGVQGQALLVEVHSAQISHGYVTWALRDQASGAVLAEGYAYEFSIPQVLGPSPYDAMCLEIHSRGTLARHYFVAVAALPA